MFIWTFHCPWTRKKLRNTTGGNTTWGVFKVYAVFSRADSFHFFFLVHVWYKSCTKYVFVKISGAHIFILFNF